MPQITIEMREEFRGARPEGSVDLAGYRFWIVPHTHWDREWYQPLETFRLRMSRVVDEVLDVLEADDEMCFTLDGQAVLLEDYVEQRPWNRDRLERLITAGRIAIGPSYVLPDEFIIGPETHVRNMLAGARVCRRHGGAPMRVGYVPDTFGHIAQMPQLMRGFGIDSFLFQRGLGDEAHDAGAAFTWRGPDGSELLAIAFVDGYSSLPNFGRWSWRGGKQHDFPDRWYDTAARRVRELVELFHGRIERAGLRDIVLANGTDHFRIQRDLPEVVEAVRDRIPGAEFHICTYEQYVDQLRATYEPRTELEGEMLGGLEHQVTRGVNSTRMYLKQLSERTEAELQDAEVLASLAWLHARKRPTPGITYDYPQGDLDLAWRDLLRNGPHDSICGCSIDEVHRDMVPRFTAARQYAAAIRREALTALAGKVETWTWNWRAITTPRHSAVNVLPWRHRGFAALRIAEELEGAASLRARLGDGVAVEAQVVRDHEGVERALVPLELGGFCAAGIELVSAEGHGPDGDPGEGTRADGAGASGAGDATGGGASTGEGGGAGAGDVSPARAAGPRSIENGLLRVDVADDGTLAVTDVATGTRHDGLHVFEDQADRGDEYNFNELEGEVPWRGTDLQAEVRVTAPGPVRAELEIRLVLPLPAELSADRTERVGEAPCPVTVRVRLHAGVDRVDFETTVDNRARDHRLRVLFPVGRHEGDVRSEGHFQVVRKPATLPVQPTWIEPPQPTHHHGGMVAAGRIAVLAQGLPEYAIVPASDDGGRREGDVAAGDEVAIAQTLLRCVGWLSRDDFPSRPYNAGPHTPTPDAQCLGSSTSHYALTLRGDATDAQLLRAAHEFRHPFAAGPEGIDVDGLVELDGDGWAFSALKLAEEGDSLVARVFAPGPEPATVTARAAGLQARRARLDETPEGGGTLPGGTLELRPYEIGTVRLDPEARE